MHTVSTNILVHTCDYNVAARLHLGEIQARTRRRSEDRGPLWKQTQGSARMRFVVFEGVRALKK